MYKLILVLKKILLQEFTLAKTQINA